MSESGKERSAKTGERKSPGEAFDVGVDVREAFMGSAGSSSSTALPHPPAAPAPATTRPRVEYDLSDMQPRREFAVTLYNDDVHDADDVVRQLMIALECPPGRATMLMLEAHNSGRATVAIADRDRAIRIATILRQIDLRVTIRQVN